MRPAFCVLVLVVLAAPAAADPPTSRVIWDGAAYIGFIAGETNAGFEHDGVHDNGGVMYDIPLGASVGLGWVNASTRGVEVLGSWRRVTTNSPWSEYVVTPSYVNDVWRAGVDLGSLDGQRVIGASADFANAMPTAGIVYTVRVYIDRISDALDDQASWGGGIEFGFGYGSR